MPSKLKKAIGAVKDQTSISLAKVSSNNSSNLEVAVLKATTHDDVPIEERYVYEVLHLVSSNKIYAAACARAIGKRIGRTRNWIVALKSLMLVLRIFQDGDPYFPREVLHANDAMKRGAKILNLSNFRDDSNSSPWDYTAFVRTFALYLDERLDCFLTGKLQRRYTHKEKESYHSSRSSRRGNEPVREMKPNMLLDKILYWQRLLERAIGTRPTGQAKANRLVQISLHAVVQESFDLYKDISDGLALLLDSFFHLQYQSCVSAFQICVKAAKQFEELSAFYSLCKGIGVGRTSEYPSVQTISEELIETLQEFLKDKSSFSANTRSPSRPLLLAAPDGSRSGRHDSYGGRSEFSYGGRSELSSYASQSEFSEMSERTCDTASQCTTSLEDLISATETGRSPSISIDLEAYSDQFEKKSQRDEPFRVSDTGSTRSLPVSTSLVDLVSLEDWPENEDERKEQEGKEEPLESSSGWELVLADAVRPPSTQSLTNSKSFESFDPFSTQEQPPNSNNFDPFSNNQQEQPLPNSNSFDLFLKQEQEQSLPDNMNTFDAFTSQQQGQDQQETGAGWELVLFETVTQPTKQTGISTNSFDASSLDLLYNNQAPAQSHHYNPFLQDLPEIPATTTTYSPVSNGGFEATFPALDSFSSESTFQATTPPTFQATMSTFQASQTAPTFQASPTAPTYQATQPTFQASPTTPTTFQASPTAPTYQASSPSFQATTPFSANSPTPTFSAQNLVQNSKSTMDDFQMFQATSPFSAKSPTPTFSVQSPVQSSKSAMGDFQNETDPFASAFSGGQMFNGSLNQQNLLHEQQLWLQQQNKIIAKHIA